LCLEFVLYCTVVLLNVNATPRARAWAAAGLASAALVGPWLSFSSAFSIAAAVLAIALHLWVHGGRRRWLEWGAIVGLAGISGGALWWISARHLYYDGMMDFWGHRGYGGFPDWSSAPAIVLWMVTRPVQVAAYGTRELGVVVAGLAVLGGVLVYRRSPPLAVLLAGPLALTMAAALLGKYPLADRTGFFLLPCLWLLAACGIGGVVEWGRRRGRQLAIVGLVLVAWDFTRLVEKVVWPDAKLDYRGAYQIAHAEQAKGDALWSQMAVVHQVYYGNQAPLLTDHEIDAALDAAKSRRLWVVVGDNRGDLRERFTATGARIAQRHHVSGLDVLLYEPGDEALR
jgi:hypothetical protein